MMYKKSIILFFISILWANLVFARQNFLYDYKEVTTPASGGVISFRLFGQNRMEDEPKKVRFRSNPYTLSIRFIADTPFKYGIISNLKFLNFETNKITFEKSELKSKRMGGSNKAGYAGFYYGDISKSHELEYVDYVISGLMLICDLDEKCEEQEFKVVFKRDYKEKTTWDFWDGIMGV